MIALAAAAAATLAVSYSGSGSYETRYHGEPPNPGGLHDTNSADDHSSQRWSLRYQQPLTVPACAGPCWGTLKLSIAAGSTSAAGTIAHVHTDGLYRILDASIHCTVRSATAPNALIDAQIRVSYTATHLTITALNPVGPALLALPAACPRQGDSIDGLDDNYFGPGFSFAFGYGPDRWFTSRTIVVRRARLNTGSPLRIRLSQTAHGTPPEHCAVEHAYERCTTGGSWSGLLTLTRIRR